jgi:hypothetical protein
VGIPSISTHSPSFHRRTPWFTTKGRRIAQRNLMLDSVRGGIPLRLVDDNPALLTLAVEDLCWRVAVDDHAKRRPARFRRAAYAAWREEQVRWEQKQGRLAEMAAEAIKQL